MHQKTGRIRLDRGLFSSVHYPADYDFVMDPIGGDGDPLDALIVVEEPTFPGCVVPSRPIGTLLMRGEIETFFAGYKELESNKSADVKGWDDADVAWKLIGDARARARGQRHEP
jgi:inorganic pyrophosphatase